MDINQIIDAECPLCQLYGVFSFLESKLLHKIDLQLMEGIEPLTLSNYRIVTVDVPIPEVICLRCLTKYRIMPDFITDGTTLTLAAQLFVASVYNTTKDGWRKITKKYCLEDSGIAHTTLYRGYHALGDKLIQKEKALCELNIICQSTFEYKEVKSVDNKDVEQNCIKDIPQKAIKEKQKMNEIRIIKALILLILSIEEGFRTFYDNLWRIADDLINQPGFRQRKETRWRRKVIDTS